MQSNLVDNHRLFGWILFAIVLFPFFMIAARLGRGERPHESQSMAGLPGGVLPSRCWVAAAVVLIALMIGPVWAYTLAGKHPANATAQMRLPVGVNGWDGPLNVGTSWVPDYAGASGEAQGHYLSSNGQVWLYNNVYLAQEQDRELVYVHNRVGGEFEPQVSTAKRDVLVEENAFTVRDIVVAEDFRFRRIMYWYEINGDRVSDDFRAKVLQAYAVLQGNPEAGLVAVSATCSFDCVAAGERIENFIVSMDKSLSLEYVIARRDSE